MLCFWVSDDAIVACLITQVLDGTKTATVCPTSSSGIPRNAFDNARYNIGDCVDLFDNNGYVHARLRITDVYTCRFNAVPEKLWRAEAELRTRAFCEPHI